MRLGRTAVVTDTGRRRLGNEDAYVWRPPLFAIADGMGGAKAGEIAAGYRRRHVRGARAADGRRRRRIGDRGREPPYLGALARRSVDVGHGHDGHGRARRRGRRHRRLRSRRRLARLSRARRGARADHDRSLARRGARRERRADAGGSRAPPAAVGDHARPRHRAGGRAGCLHGRGRSRRPLPPLLRRALGHAHREPDRSRDRAGRRRPGGRRGRARQGRERAGRGRQHHRAALRSPRGRSEPAEGCRCRDSAQPAAADGSGADTETEAQPADPGGRLRKHGAGPGGRLAAILFILAVLAVGALVLYWGIAR